MRTLRMPATHYAPPDQVHFTWDAGHAPSLTIADGDTVVFHTRDVSDNQIGPGSDASVVAGMDWDRVYPLVGPVYVEGAKPGDTLAVEILDLHTQGWGWTAILPGLGLLADEFPDPYLRVFDISNGDVVPFREDIEIPLTPFLGTMGVCPAGASTQPVMPPGTFGGNMDTRQLVAGTTLYLPVQVAPQFKTAGPLTPSVDFGGWYGTTGVGGDLYKASQDAIRAMIAHLGEHHGLSAEDAYLLCSLCVDLKISEIVDAGEYIVSALLPDAVFVG
jgi:acetamidase/formamidase